MLECEKMRQIAFANELNRRARIRIKMAPPKMNTNNSGIITTKKRLNTVDNDHDVSIGNNTNSNLDNYSENYNNYIFNNSYGCESNQFLDNARLISHTIEWLEKFDKPPKVAGVRISHEIFFSLVTYVAASLLSILGTVLWDYL